MQQIKNLCFLWTFLLGIFLYPTKINAQNKMIADSLVALLKNSELSVEDKFRINLRIAKSEDSPQNCLKHAQQALILAQQVGTDTLVAESWEEIGIIHRVLGNSAASFNASFEALKIYEKANMTQKQAAIFNQIGLVYIGNKNYKHGIIYLQKSLKHYTKLKNTLRITGGNINIGEAYRLIGKLDSAEFYFNKSLALSKTLNNNLIFAYTIGNLGLVHAEKGKFEEAKISLNQAIDILTELGNVSALAVYKSKFGEILLHEGKHKPGELILLESLVMAQREGLKEQICDISLILAKLYEKRQRYNTALVYRKQYEQYKDSLANYENVRQIEQLRSDYEIKKKETEISYLNKANAIQKKIGIGLSMGVLIFLILAFFMFRLYKGVERANIQLNKQKDIIRQRELEKELLLKELNHRVKNNLQMIASLLNLQSTQLKGHPAAESLQAGKYRVEALSLVHQKLYKEDFQSKILLNDYFEELALNLVHGFDKSVNLKLDLEEVEVKIDTAIPLGLIANELITNSLKYAFKKQNITKPTLDISIKKNNNLLVLSIADNGIGIPDVQLTGTSDSFGLKLVRSLTKQLNAQLEYANGNGSNWSISILDY